VEIPDPPEILDDYAIQEWRRVTPVLAGLGILCRLDRALLAAYCTSYSQWTVAREEMRKRVEMGGVLASLVDVTKAGNVVQNPLVGIANKAARDMVRYGELLGMGESARARIGIDRSKGEKSKFDGLIGLPGGKR
jgi:P27 family predicted phage terminase small subunit